MSLRSAFTSRVAAAALVLGVCMTPAAGAESQQPVTESGTKLSTTWSVAANPHIVVNRDVTNGLLLGLLLLSGGLYAYGLRHHQKGAGFRALATGALALAVYNPQLVLEHHEKMPTEVGIIVDKSASQSIDGRDKTTAAAYAELVRQLSRMEGVHINTIDAGGGIKDGKPQEGTKLFDGWHYMSRIPDTVFVLTDGQVHDVPARPDALALQGPLHVLVSGRDGEKDRVAVIDQAPAYGFVNQKQTIKFHVTDDGDQGGKGRKVRVDINADGKKIASKTVMAGAPSEIEVTLPHAGANIIDIQAQPYDGELTAINNRAVAQIEGIRESLNVLFISGEPNNGVRTWRNLFKADPDTRFVHFMVMRPLDKLDDTPVRDLALSAFPMKEVFSDNAKKFDLIIFDHYRDEGIIPSAYLENIADYVRGGGALLVVSGPEYAGTASLYNSALGDILPAAPTGRVSELPYVPRVSEHGKRHPVVRALGDDGSSQKNDAPPWGRWFRLVESSVKSGEAVMQGAGGQPLLILDRGKSGGRVAMLMSDQSWLWARGVDGGGPYADLLTRIPHWLMKDPAFEEEFLRLTAERSGNLVVEQQTMSDRSKPVTLQTPSGRNIRVVPEAAGPGQWRAAVGAESLDGPGLYSAEQGNGAPMKAFVNIGPPNPDEWKHTLTTTEGPLKKLAEATGGGVARMTDAEGNVNLPRIVPVDSGAPDAKMSGPGWTGIRMNNQTVVSGVDRVSLPPPLVSLLVVMGAMAAAFWRESGISATRKPKKENRGGPSI